MKRLLPAALVIAAATAAIALARPDQPPAQAPPEAPKSETPAAEAPKQEAPKQEAPKADAPAVAVPPYKAVFPASWFFDGNKMDLVGKPAPAFDVADWRGGEPVKLSDLKGKIVVLDFWGAWCPPCRAAVPHTNKIAEAYKDKGVAVIGIHSKRVQEKMKETAKALNMGYPTAKDTYGRSERDYKVTFWPYYVMIDREGVVRAAGLNPHALANALDEMLKEQPFKAE